MQNESKAFAAAALALGLCSVLLPFVFAPLAVAGLVSGAVGTVLAAIAMRMERSALAAGGLVLSIIGAALCVVLIILAVALVLGTIGFLGALSGMRG